MAFARQAYVIADSKTGERFSLKGTKEDWRGEFVGGDRVPTVYTGGWKACQMPLDVCKQLFPERTLELQRVR